MGVLSEAVPVKCPSPVLLPCWSPSPREPCAVSWAGESWGRREGGRNASGWMNSGHLRRPWHGGRRFTGHLERACKPPHVCLSVQLFLPLLPRFTQCSCLVRLCKGPSFFLGVPSPRSSFQGSARAARCQSLFSGCRVTYLGAQWLLPESAAPHTAPGSG